MGNPAISIIVPIYNVEEYISKCLESILAQTITNIEVIVVNDGSTDKSSAICEAYAIKDQRLKVIQQNKQGVSAARNAGINQATGNFIGFVDGDDYIEINMYEKLYQACLETRSDIAICTLGREINGELMNLDRDGDEENQLVFNNEAAMSELFKGHLYRFSLCNKLFNKKCFAGITFPVGRIHEDLSTTYKLFANADQTVYLDFIGYIYVKREESILTKAYYEKRLEAFIGWEEIVPYMRKEYPQLGKIVNACFTYNCIDHIYYISDQVRKRNDRVKFLKSIRIYIRKDKWEIFKNGLLSLKSKLIILLFCCNITVFSLLHRIAKLKVKGKKPLSGSK